MERPNLLVLSSTFPRWNDDTEPRFVFDLCQRLKSRCNIHVLAPHASGARTFEELHGLKITRFRYAPARLESLAYTGGMLARIRNNPVRLLLLPGFVLSAIMATRRLLKTQRVALVHAHWIVPQGLVAIASQLGSGTRVPVLCTAHGGDLYALRGRFFVMLKRWILRRSDGLTVVSAAMHADAMRLTRWPESRCEVIPMGTDLRNLFRPSPEGAPRGKRLLFVGRLVPKKGLDYLIEALALVRAHHPQATLDVVGSGPEEPRLRARAASLGLWHAIRFHGAVSHAALPQFYRGAAITVVPSVIDKDGDREGFGLVAVEALGCGCAVIASDLPAIGDTIRDGVTGLLARAADAAHLAERIASLLEQPALRAKLAAQGRAYVLARYDWEHVAARYGELISALIENHHRHAGK
ncbi:MAG: glycosyltransferase [Gammaproteobacteria bacterium]